MLEGQFKAESLLGTVSALLEHSEMLESMARASAALHIQNAVDRILELLLDLINK
jgi:UDP-N-acetylglucosamine:LPS N-acetylglucosamine transferase